jgi:hypothetical protein
MSTIVYGRLLEEQNMIETLHRAGYFVAIDVLMKEGTTLRWSKGQGCHVPETIRDFYLLPQFPDLKGKALTRMS